jgi:ATP-dependent Clp protease ATP-binding subunit ClpA
MKISENLNRIIMAAYAEANVRRHEFITPEHLLYACLFFDEGKELILNCGGDPGRLKKTLEKHLDETDTVATTTRALQSLGFQSILERAAWHTSSAQKEILDLGDVLVSILDERGSAGSHSSISFRTAFRSSPAMKTGSAIRRPARVRRKRSRRARRSRASFSGATRRN